MIITNTEIAYIYNVSLPAVNNWIKNSQLGKNNLILHSAHKKLQVVDSEHNRAELKRLSEFGKKFKTSRVAKKVVVPKKFYEIFNDEEIIEIVTDLEFYKKIRFKYSYKDAGSKLWSDFYDSHVSPIEKSISEILQVSIDNISYYLGSNEINIIDIGPGTGHPTKELVNFISQKRKINKYIGIDISQSILEITLKNMSSWFPDLETTDYVTDLENGKFSKIFLESKLSGKNLVNLILHIGDTLCDLGDRSSVLKNLRKGLQFGDILVLSVALDTENNRSQLNFVKTPEANSQDGWLLNMIGIDVDLCEFNVVYDSTKKAKVKDLILDKDYELHFDLFGTDKVIELNKGEKINTWVHNLMNIPDFIEELAVNKLELLSVNIDNNLHDAIVICKSNFDL